MSNCVDKSASFKQGSWQSFLLFFFLLMSALKPKVATLEIFFEVVELSTQSGQQRRTVGAISGLAFTKLLKIFLRPFL